jgi:hypothetical protein
LLKSELEEGSNPDDVQEPLAKILQLKQMEDDQAVHWRRLSRIKWLGEREEVSKYYFQLLKAKQKKESLLLLITDEGAEISNLEEILKETTKFYETLYTANRSTLKTSQARSKLFACPCNQVEPGAKAMLEALPTLRELREMLLLISLDKSPGMDGLTAKVF